MFIFPNKIHTVLLHISTLCLLWFDFPAIAFVRLKLTKVISFCDNLNWHISVFK